MALMYMLQGKNFRPPEALAMKVVDELAEPGKTVEAAKAWVKANPGGNIQPWDVKGFKVPGGSGQFNPGFIQTMMAATVMTTKETQRNIHAPHALLSAVYEGLQLPMDRAIRVESKYFAKVVADPQARYWGVAIDERTLVPGEGATLFDIRFEDWMLETAARS